MNCCHCGTPISEDRKYCSFECLHPNGTLFERIDELMTMDDLTNSAAARVLKVGVTAVRELRKQLGIKSPHAARPPAKLLTDRRSALLDLTGTTHRDAAKQLGCSDATVREARKQLGIQSPHRHLRLLTWHGETLTLRQWSERQGLPLLVLKQRIDRGWSVQKTLTLPVTRGRKPRLMTVDGKRRTSHEWAKRTGVPHELIMKRLWKGWSDAEAIRPKACKSKP